jgi:hypothetical protein
MLQIWDDPYFNMLYGIGRVDLTPWQVPGVTRGCEYQTLAANQPNIEGSHTTTVKRADLARGRQYLGWCGSSHVHWSDSRSPTHGPVSAWDHHCWLKVSGICGPSLCGIGQWRGPNTWARGCWMVSYPKPCQSHERRATEKEKVVRNTNIARLCFLLTPNPTDLVHSHVTRTRFI